MLREWNGGKVAVYFDDLENEKVIRRSFSDAIEDLNEEQISQFTSAIDSLTVLPVAHTVVIEEYKYIP